LDELNQDVLELKFRLCFLKSSFTRLLQCAAKVENHWFRFSNGDRGGIPYASPKEASDRGVVETVSNYTLSSQVESLQLQGAFYPSNVLTEPSIPAGLGP
jgi:hypothetical protein